LVAVELAANGLVALPQQPEAIAGKIVMAIVSLAEIKQQLRIDHDDDDALLTRKIASAQDHLERLLGFKIENTYGGESQDPVPPAMVECVSQLAAHWYENREATMPDAPELLPLSVYDVVSEYRNYSWADEDAA
jgi:uncharacterized phage protein (predicted DNA packaging)